jgi:putative transposase
MPSFAATPARPSIHAPLHRTARHRLSLHDKTIVVTRCGRICLGKKKINFSQVFAGQAVGIREVHDDIWLVSFMDYDLGYFDLETRVLQPLENPFGPKVLPMS